MIGAESVARSSTSTATRPENVNVTTTMASIPNGTNGAASVQVLSAYFSELDSIKEDPEQALETPVVLVFGEESAGKSTILERFARSSCESTSTIYHHGSPLSRMRESSTTPTLTRKRKYERSWRKRSNGRTTISWASANEPDTMEEDTHELLNTWIERQRGAPFIWRFGRLHQR